MSKKLNIGALKIDIPEHNGDVGRAIEALQNAYERGEIKAMFTVYASDVGISSAIVGHAMSVPFVALAAEALASRVLGDIADNIAGYGTGEGDDE